MTEKKTDKRNRNRLLLRLLMMVIVITFGCVGSVVSYAVARQGTISGSDLLQGFGPDLKTSQPTSQAANPGSSPDSQSVSSPILEPTLTPWDGASRVTVLLLGLDYRDWQAGKEAARSDTMILLTLDPLKKTAGILSIPRDMWVAIPGFKHGKINTAHYLGDVYDLPGGGPGLAVKTVENFLGVPINYYARIDFGAFVSFIDEIGGVKIDVPEEITVDLLGSGSSTIKTLQPGVQTLPGEWALAYARARHTQGGDFDRARRQQQVIMGIRDRILTFNMLPTLIKNGNVLYSQLASGIHTNLTLDDAARLALLASQISKEDIRTGVLGEKYVLFGRSPDNLSILIPIPDKIHVLRDEIFATSGVLSPLTPGGLEERVGLEQATALIVNQSGSPGLGQATAQHLRSLGVNVLQVEQGQRSAYTSVRMYTSKPHTLKYLADFMGTSSARIRLGESGQSQADLELYLGSDWSANNPLD
jgi:LCP family protein required for cell wall assembly